MTTTVLTPRLRWRPADARRMQRRTPPSSWSRYLVLGLSRAAAGVFTRDDAGAMWGRAATYYDRECLAIHEAAK